MPIEAISNLVASDFGRASATSGTTSEGKFSDVLNEALNNAKETEAQDQIGAIDLVTGENDSIHTTMIESQKAELALNLAIQVRNKVIDAYNEVMRMQV